MGSLSEPLISIITSTFNAKAALQKTAESIRGQTYTEIQWIVVDGASTDGTVDVILCNGNSIDFWVSERDNGIYDAWNKGCAQIRGEWVLFLGAGDELASPDTLATCVEYLNAAAGSHDIVYGRIQLVGDDGTIVAELGQPWEKIKGKWGGLLPLLPPHPSSFHHRRLFSAVNSFDAAFRYAGDTAFVVRSVLRQDPLYIPVLVDRMLAGGVSASPGNILEVAQERRVIARKLGVHPPILHTLRWNVGLFAQVAMYRLVPAALRRAIRRVIRAG